MWRYRLMQSLLILGVPAAQAFVGLPQTCSVPCRISSSSQLHVSGFLDALRGRSNNNQRGDNDYYYDNDDDYYYQGADGVKRYRGEPGLGGTSSPYSPPAKIEGYYTDTPTSNKPSGASSDTSWMKGASNFSPLPVEEIPTATATTISPSTEPRAFGSDNRSSANRITTGIPSPQTDRTNAVPAKVPVSTPSTPTMAAKKPPLVSGTRGFPTGTKSQNSAASSIPSTSINNNNNNSGRTSMAPAPIPAPATPATNSDPNVYYPRQQVFQQDYKDNSNNKQSEPPFSLDDDISWDDIMTDSDDTTVLSLQQVFIKVQSLARDNQVLKRQLKIAQGIEHDRKEEQERLEQDIALLQTQLVQWKNSCRATEYERQALQERINLLLQEREATKVDYERKLSRDTRLTQADRRLRQQGIYAPSTKAKASSSPPPTRYDDYGRRMY